MKGDDKMQAIAQTIRTKKPEHPELNTVNTTLYELVEAISKEVDPAEDQLIPAIVSDLLDRRLIMPSDSMEESVTSFFIN